MTWQAQCFEISLNTVLPEGLHDIVLCYHKDCMATYIVTTRTAWQRTVFPQGLHDNAAQSTGVSRLSSKLTGSLLQKQVSMQNLVLLNGWQCDWFIYVPRCQHDNGYMDGQSQKVHERKQVHSTQSSLVVTHPSTYWARRYLSSVTESPSKHWLPPQTSWTFEKCLNIW